MYDRALVGNEWSAPRLGRFIPREWILVPTVGSSYRAGTVLLAVESLLSYHSLYQLSSPLLAESDF
jgi:hypothetical protein